MLSTRDVTRLVFRSCAIKLYTVEYLQWLFTFLSMFKSDGPEKAPQQLLHSYVFAMYFVITTEGCKQVFSVLFQIFITLHVYFHLPQNIVSENQFEAFCHVLNVLEQ